MKRMENLLGDTKFGIQACDSTMPGRMNSLVNQKLGFVGLKMTASLRTASCEVEKGGESMSSNQIEFEIDWKP